MSGGYEFLGSGGSQSHSRFVSFAFLGDADNHLCLSSECEWISGEKPGSGLPFLIHPIATEYGRVFSDFKRNVIARLD